MELLRQMVIKGLDRGEIQIHVSKETTALLESKCYQTLKEIVRIVRDERLEDPECFRKIEDIVCTLEWIGIDGGSRHDF